MNGSPPRMPKNELPIALASPIRRFMAAGSIFDCFAATSTQHPWQRRLQLLMIETYRNGGKNSPRLRRLLCFWTERTPLRPKFHISFQRRRLSVSQRRRLAIRKYIAEIFVGRERGKSSRRTLIIARSYARGGGAE